MFGAFLIKHVLFLSILIPLIESVTRLNQYIRHYEPVHYDTGDLKRSHARAKRSVTRNHVLDLRFEAHGRHFALRMRRDLGVFSDNLEVIDSRGKPFETQPDTSHVYHGHIVGEPDSYVFGSILDGGHFEGKIISPKSGNYYVEKAARYFRPLPSNSSSSSTPSSSPSPAPQSAVEGGVGFHSVIYREADVEDPYEHLRSGHFGGCGVPDNPSSTSWMDRIANSGVEPAADSNKHNTLDSNNLEENRLNPLEDERGEEAPHEKYSREANTRKKRATRIKDDGMNTCSLFIQTDPLIWKHISEQVNNNAEKTREEILSLIAHHVTAVNYIYRDTKFDGQIEHRNIKFEVQRIKIDDDLACQPHYQGEVNHFCMENIDVSNFLNLHSLSNHEDFCLAYVFTYRDFTGGTLGLAWVASASGASGGICEKYKTYTETIGGLYQSTKRSLNTGIITFVNYNSRVPPKVSQLTLAHEIGHNFGSPHDYPGECRPGGLNGNYIMFASATSGDRPNNSKFSSCSIANISSVLDAIHHNKNKKNCFKASEGAFCGNKIVEAGEECDCGYDGEECNDPCCYPRQMSEMDKMKNGSARGCHRRAFTECSPSQGPCCYSDTCRFVPSSHNIRCKGEAECSWSSTCSGKSPECPAPPPKANKTRCNEGTQLCINGECTGSICLEWGMQECFLTSQSNTDKRKLCELACTMPAPNETSGRGQCRSTSEFAESVGLPPGGISLRPGSPCDNFQGYCDVFYKCRAVDAEGPLARLKNMLLNRETLQTLRLWSTENWWACLVGGVAFIIFMGGVIKCCAVHTPSSNPKKQQAARFSETLRRPMNTLRRMRGPHHHQHGMIPSRPGPSGGPSHHRGGPSHGHGANRSNHHHHHHHPRASAPPAANSSSRGDPSGYHGDARNNFHMTRQHQNNV
uniref:ADAM10 endopeptidase n=1 Tax=Cacopsylla melanoneura TaxID=428564 RepID=A0A8D9FBH6_9HEMI